MQKYTNLIKYKETLQLIDNLNDKKYLDSVIFHCFWNGELNEKHYISILSCYYFNIKKYSNRKIILWYDKEFIKNEWYEKISLIAEIKLFDLSEEIKDTFFENYNINSRQSAYSYISDIIRYVLLYKYGGIWFDLDIFFLRNFDKLISTFTNEICVYNWADQPHPNGAYFQNIQKNNEKFRDFVIFMIDRNRGFGFQESYLTYDLPVDLLVLPASWFDGCFCLDFNEPFEKLPNGGPDLKYFFKYTNVETSIDTFTEGAFCYHWHNCWYDNYEIDSWFDRLKNDLIYKNLL